MRHHAILTDALTLALVHESALVRDFAGGLHTARVEEGDAVVRAIQRVVLVLGVGFRV